jgi:HSP20 family protein
MNTPLMMPLVRRDVLGTLFDDFFNDMWSTPAWVPASMLAETSPIARARMDVLDKGEKFEVKVDLPGVRKEDIDVTIEGCRVAIKAEVKEEKEVKEGDRLLHTERSFTSYARSFELPTEVTESGSEAVYENGVLTLTLPKRAGVTSRRLAIH